MVGYQPVRLVLGAMLGALLALSLTIASAQGRTVTVTENTVDASGVTATVTLTEQGSQTMITVSAQGLTPGSSNENEVHFGTCANTGNIAFTLSPLVGSANGTAAVSTTINAPLASLQDGNHLLHIHATNAAGAVLACGDIPMAAAAATATPAATSPAVAATATPAATAVAAMATPMATPVATATTTPATLPATGGMPKMPVAALGAALLGIGYYVRRRR